MMHASFKGRAVHTQEAASCPEEYEEKSEGRSNLRHDDGRAGVRRTDSNAVHAIRHAVDDEGIYDDCYGHNPQPKHRELPLAENDDEQHVNDKNP
eukprot:scaffold115231_cov38-Tisochrysis_lutea.AAC.3